MTRTKVSWCIFWPVFLARSHSSGLVCRMLLRFFLWMFHATETHRQRQLLCHSTGCGLATKMTVVCVLIETLPWILSLQQYQDLFIKMKMSWLTWTPLSASRMMFVGESLPRPMLHEQPASLCIFPKSWCSVIKHSPSPEQPGSWGYLSKGDQLQPNKSLLKLETFFELCWDTKVNPLAAGSGGHLTSPCWSPKHREMFL